MHYYILGIILGIAVINMVFINLQVWEKVYTEYGR